MLMSYNDYRNEVIKIFKKSMPDLSDAEINKYFNAKDTDDVVRNDYKSFSGKNLANISPSGTASCLYMLY